MIDTAADAGENDQQEENRVATSQDQGRVAQTEPGGPQSQCKHFSHTLREQSCRYLGGADRSLYGSFEQAGFRVAEAEIDGDVGQQESQPGNIAVVDHVDQVAPPQLHRWFVSQRF